MGVVALVVAVILAGLAYLSPSPEDRGHALALSFAAGHDYRFHVHGLLDGTATAGMHTSQVRETLEAILTLHVAAVDPTGVAKVRSSLSNVSDRLNGHGQHSSGAATVLNIAPDGRIGYISVGKDGESGTAGVLAGLDQLTPLLPSDPVNPGDQWTIEPAGQTQAGGSASGVTAKSTLVTYETVAGSTTAVVTSHILLPLSFSVGIPELLGQGADATSTLGGTRFRFAGNASLSQTSWLDPVARELVGSSVLGHVDVTARLIGPAAGSTTSSTARFVGTLALEAHRLPSSSTGGDSTGAARDMLRQAMAAAGVYFEAGHSYEGFTPSKASSLVPGIRWRAGGKARAGFVTIRNAGAVVLLLVTQDASGKPLCIARAAGRTKYGRVGASRARACRGGW